MTVEFEKPKNEFPKTFAQAIVAIVVAAVIGCILGDSVTAYLGTNMEYEVNNRYAERYSAALTWFADDMEPLTDEYGVQLTDENGDPILGVYFQRVAQALTGQDGLRILRSASGSPMVVQDGQVQSATEALGDELGGYLEELFQLPDCFEDNIDTMTEEPIDDVYLYNIAVSGDTVLFYVFYDEYGYMTLTYDPTETLTETDDEAVALSSAPGWYVQFDYTVE